MVQNSKDNTKMEKKMEKVFSLGLMEINILVCFITIRNKEKE